MKLVTNTLIAITSLLHMLFFKLESLDFMQPEVLAKFGLDAESANYVVTWAFNQGFYNLFLAFGLLYGLYLLNFKSIDLATPLLSCLLLIIAGAGLVLYISAPEKAIVASVQALPALIGLISLQLYKRSLTS